ncbi:RICIN domain-containing protein [Streptomyces sp. NPDC048606]|uniref:RICIN domain-containing protein n=1 Tax=Streptomyces sp. NPDC048606 TaxID=3154726 RepID=UPI00344655F7
MFVLSARTARAAGFLAATALITLGVVPATPAAAATGPEVATGKHPYAVRIALGGETDGRACTGTLVDRYWVLTAASCFATVPGTTVPAGPPAIRATATLGDGRTLGITELAPRDDRDVVLARLASPVVGAPTAKLATSAPTAGATLSAAGFGRTRTEWVPDKPHAAAFTLNSSDATSLTLTGKGTDAICKGDTGGPLLNAADQLVAVNSRSWQGGCLGTATTETRTGALSARVDDLGPWLRKVTLTTASIVNTLSGKCAYVSWRTPENSAPAVMVDCDPQYTDQIWKFVPVPGGGHLIRNEFTGRCLFVSWRTPDDGAPVQQFDCNPQYNDQIWKLEPVPAGGYLIRNAQTNRCMLVSWRTPDNGAPVVQVGCDPQYIDQVWKL